MHNNWLYLVLFVLLSIIPALTVAVILYLRQEGVKGDVTTAVYKVDCMVRDYDAVLKEHQSITNQITTLSGELHASRAKVISLEESFVNLSNKWNSRLRAERAEESHRKRREEKEEEAGVPEGIPGTEQMEIPFDPNYPPPVTTPQIKKNERRFGQLPSFGG